MKGPEHRVCIGFQSTWPRKWTQRWSSRNQQFSTRRPNFKSLILHADEDHQTKHASLCLLDSGRCFSTGQPVRARIPCGKRKIRRDRWEKLFRLCCSLLLSDFLFFSARRHRKQRARAHFHFLTCLGSGALVKLDVRKQFDESLRATTTELRCGENFRLGSWPTDTRLRAPLLMIPTAAGVDGKDN